MAVERVMHIDGGARGNPGPAGAGVVIRAASGALIHEGAYFLGEQTNNAAEYLALLRGLSRALQDGPASLVVHSDSELLVQQITGNYRVKSEKLAALFEQAQRQLLRVPRWSFRHVRREQNRRADELANIAMDRRGDVIVFDVDATAAPAATPDASTVAPDLPAAAPPAPPSTPRPAPAPGAVESAPAAQSVHSFDGVAGARGVHMHVGTRPSPDLCPAGGLPFSAVTIGPCLPDRLCAHAALTILPTVLAMQNAEPTEFGSIPTLTVRCIRAGCGAVFQLSPAMASNGHSR